MEDEGEEEGQHGEQCKTGKIKERKGPVGGVGANSLWKAVHCGC